MDAQSNGKIPCCTKLLYSDICASSARTVVHYENAAIRILYHHLLISIVHQLIIGFVVMWYFVSRDHSNNQWRYENAAFLIHSGSETPITIKVREELCLDLYCFRRASIDFDVNNLKEGGYKKGETHSGLCLETNIC